MDVELNVILNLLKSVPGIKYVDEDNGQLDAYSPHPPAKFPCALLDIGTIGYENIGMDKTKTPVNRQSGTGSIVITVANLKLANTSGNAPQTQKDKAWHVHSIIKEIHAKLQGVKVSEEMGSLIRLAFKRIRRDDGIQEYEITYTAGLHNV